MTAIEEQAIRAGRARRRALIGAVRRAPLVDLALLAFAAVLLALTLPTSAPFSTDETQYAHQVDLLIDGTWSYEWPGQAIDPEYRLRPFGVAGESGISPYIKHPAYPWALAQSVQLLGEELGLRLLGVFGLVLAALAAYYLAQAVFPGTERWAFWLAALGPAAIDASLLWAHAPAAALAGWLLYSAVSVGVSARPAAPMAAVGLFAFLGPFLRRELIIFGVAVAVMLFALGVVHRKDRAAVLTTGALALVATAVGAVLTRWWTAAISGQTVGTSLDSETDSLRLLSLDSLPDRLEGVYRVLLRGDFRDGPGGALAVAALISVGIAVWAVIKRNRTIVAAGLGTATVLIFVRLLAAPDAISTGLLVAYPVVVFGALALRRPWPRRLLPVVLSGGLFVVGVALTITSVGGGLEWGGRYLRPLTVPLAVLCAQGVREAAEVYRDRALVALLGGVVLLPLVAGFIAVERERDRNVELQRALLGIEGPAVVVEGFRPRFLPWERFADEAWFANLRADELPETLSALSRGGLDEAILVALQRPGLPGEPLPTPHALHRAGLTLRSLDLGRFGSG